MNKYPFIALCLSVFVGFGSAAYAVDGVDSTGPSPDSTGPTNPTPPTLPTPGTGVDNGTGTGIDGPDNAPVPGTDGTGRHSNPAVPVPHDKGKLPADSSTQGDKGGS